MQRLENKLNKSFNTKKEQNRRVKIGDFFVKKKKGDDSVAEEIKDAAEDIKETVEDAVEDIVEEVKED